MSCATGGRHSPLPDRIVAIGIQEQRIRARSLCQLFGDTAVTGSAECCMQCHAFNGRENVPMAPMMHDRAEGEALPYTHEFLSHMLGANRKSVTLAARSLQMARLISYRRGKIQVL